MKGVSFQYDGSSVLSVSEIDLSVRQGECVVLCGKSGCGKTTVTKLANGLIPHLLGGKKNGTVTIDGNDIDGMPMYRLSAVIGSVFQNPKSQFFNLDTDSELTFTLQNQGVIADRIYERLDAITDELCIGELRGRNIFELSGGEKQLIAIASVYAADPPVYVLDEPTANLDFLSVRKFREILQKLKEKGKTILIAEHRLSYLDGIADRVVYIEDGKIAKEFAAGDFFCISEQERIDMGLRRIHDVCKSENKIPPVSREVLMQVCNISVAYGKQRILQNIAFSACKGDVIGITGSNGVGKSTLCRVICGLHPVKSGVIRINGKILNEKGRRSRSYTVMQDVNHQLLGDSVWNECIGLESDDRKIETVLEKFDLLTVKNSHPMALSGGQKQRLAIAASLLLQRDIYIFDEPTSGLDYKSMMDVREYIADVAGNNAVVLLITHDMELLDTLCSRCLFIQKNGVVEVFRDSRSFSRIVEEMLINHLSLDKANHMPYNIQRNMWIPS